MWAEKWIKTKTIHFTFTISTAWDISVVSLVFLRNNNRIKHSYNSAISIWWTLIPVESHHHGAATIVSKWHLTHFPNPTNDDGTEQYARQDKQKRGKESGPRSANAHFPDLIGSLISSRLIASNWVRVQSVASAEAGHSRCHCLARVPYELHCSNHDIRPYIGEVALEY